MVGPDSRLPDNSTRRDSFFPSTHWSVVVQAGKDSSPDARQAVGTLYERYRLPLLIFLRSRGNPEDAAEEIIHGFFELLLEKRGLGKVKRTGRFRSWLLACLKHYLSDQWDRSRAMKRGGREAFVPIGTDEDAPGIDAPSTGRTPDVEYDRQFALRFVDDVMARLEREYEARGKGELYGRLHVFLLDKQIAMSHAAIGKELAASEAVVSAEISKMRKRYRQIFDEELLNLVEDREELEAEKQFLFTALRR